jgi:SAM-dependent methyltransferase
VNPAEFHNIARVEESFWWYRGMHRILLRLLPRYLASPPRRVLEAGGGTGDFARRLAQRLSAPIDLLDLSGIGLGMARRRGWRRLVQADLRSLPLRDASYDLVFCLDVVAHFEPGKEAPAMAELARVLAPAGLLVMRASALDILRSRHSLFVDERQRFTRPRLLAAVRHAGLEALRCTYLNSLLLPVALLKFRVIEPLTRAAPATGVAPLPGWLNTALGAFLRLEEAWLAAGRGFPLGQSLLLFARKPR